jgi:RHS repeat-associated protein
VYDNATTGEFGNLTNINAASSAYTGCTQESLSVTALSNNQLSATGFSYDASGNLVADGRNNYGINAESQIKSVSGFAGVTYTYDGDGHRVEKSNGKLYWYGTGSDPLMETDLSGNLTYEYIFFGGKRIARRDSSNNVVYYAADHLGTSRVVASSTGAILDQSDFYPFGGERILAASSGNTYKFTSKERDSESNLDNFGARYDSSILGRFMSADLFSQKLLENPQDLNLYLYTVDNPLRYKDPNGRDWRDVVSGIAQGANNFVNHTYSAVVAATKDPLTVVQGLANAVSTAVTAYGTADGRKAMTDQFKSLSTQDKAAVVTEALVGGAVAGAAKATTGGAPATEATTTVTHFTSDAGVAAITDAGGILNGGGTVSGTFVAAAGDIPAGATSSQVESLLEIGPGKGANSITFDTPNSNLVIPGNGPTTSGGATQFQLQQPTQINPSKFVKTDPQQ